MRAHERRVRILLLEEVPAKYFFAQARSYATRGREDNIATVNPTKRGTAGKLRTLRDRRSSGTTAGENFPVGDRGEIISTPPRECTPVARCWYAGDADFSSAAEEIGNHRSFRSFVLRTIDGLHCTR